eukprot:414499-Prorocentrum_minimum.AAC.4
MGTTQHGDEGLDLEDLRALLHDEVVVLEAQLDELRPLHRRVRARHRHDLRLPREQQVRPVPLRSPPNGRDNSFYVLGEKGHAGLARRQAARWLLQGSGGRSWGGRPRGIRRGGPRGVPSTGGAGRVHHSR